MSRKAQKIFVGISATLLAFLGISAYSIWEDGRRFAFVEAQPQPAQDGVAAASYLDVSRFQWKTGDELHEYAREHRLELADRMEGNRAP